MVFACSSSKYRRAQSGNWISLNKDHINNGDDHYYGNMLNNDSFKNALRLYDDNVDPYGRIKMIYYLFRNNYNRSHIINYVTIKEILLILRMCNKIITQNEKLKKSISSLILENNTVKSFPINYVELYKYYSPIKEFIYYYAVKRILESYASISTLIYPYEEKGIERAILIACNENSKSVKKIGFAHALHSQGHLYLNYY